MDRNRKDILGDHAEIECEIDNVPFYLDGVAARKVARDIDVCAWLMLLGIYRISSSRNDAMTVAQLYAAAACSSSKAIAHITYLLKKEEVCFQAEDNRSQPLPPSRKKGASS